MADAFAPGFRLSTTDVVTLAVGAIGGAALWPIDPRLAAGVWFVVAHFFLFCNILRMRRSFELTWSAVFLILVVAHVQFEALSSPAVFLGSLIATTILAIVETRSPSYHGVGWRTLNPGLPDWWQSKQSL